MLTKNTYILIIAIVILSTVAGIYFYPTLPERMASHWNGAGEVDGYSGKFWGTFLMPIISLALLLLFVFLPKIDPLKKNIVGFRKEYNLIFVILMLFLGLFFVLSLVWNLGYEFNFAPIAVLAVAVLLYAMGWLLPKMKRNWFMGIRTPWTLSSDTVWEKTHKQGGRVFRAAGILALISLAFPGKEIWIAIAPLMLAVIWTFIYSYLAFRKEKNETSQVA